MNKLENAEIAISYRVKVDEILGRTTLDKVDTAGLEKRLIDALEDAANSTIPKKEKPPQCKHEIFKDDSIINEIIDQRATTDDPIKKKELTKLLKKRAHELRTKKLEKEAEEITLHSIRKQTEKLFKTFKKNVSSFKKHTSTQSCDPQQLKEHFEKHFDLPGNMEVPKEIIEMPEYLKHLKDIPVDTIVQGVPSELEIANAIRKLKNGKSSADIPAELLKYAISSPEAMKELKMIFEEIWKEKKVPPHFGNSRMTAIFKNKGKITDPKMYRMIQTSKITTKLLSMIILQRINPWIENQLLQYQLGFRQGSGTAEGILAV